MVMYRRYVLAANCCYTDAVARLDELGTVVESKENVSSDSNTPPEQRLARSQITDTLGGYLLYCLLKHKVCSESRSES